MQTLVRWLGHSAVYLETSGHKILIDPFLTGNPAAAIPADKAQADFILVSHGHADHLGDTIKIAKGAGATVICNYEISEWLAKQGVKAHGQQHGGGFNHPFGRVKLTLAFHGSMLPDGSNGGNPGTGPTVGPNPGGPGPGVANRTLRLAYKAKPIPTQAMLDTATFGTVTIRVTVGADGRLISYTPVQRLSNGGTQAAIEALLKCRFLPAIRDGQYVADTQIIRFEITAN